MKRRIDPVEQMTGYLARCTECGDCLLWTGPTARAGSPVVGASKSLRRLVWRMREGPLPSGKVVVNACGRAACIEHLALSSPGHVLQAVIARPDVGGRKAKAARTSLRLRAAKLDLAKARAIRASAKTQAALAAEFNIAQSLVSRIINNTAWREDAASPFAGLGASHGR